MIVNKYVYNQNTTTPDQQKFILRSIWCYQRNYTNTKKATEFIPNFEGKFSREHHKYYGYPWNKDTLEVDQVLHQNCIDKRLSAQS